ncbi:site-specific recombinase XerD [Saccharothrix texasensis]|uniref:Site-specific recombinase XerD n=1 Tax=Saccharothrix texasensis TaxID=103734 RepID=A0A3N1H495_9PSEU|nr:site-specific recombinase XerD [Saccharothrix texasensis]
MGLSVVRDLREARSPANADELADFEVDAMAGFVLTRASTGLADTTIRGEISNVQQVRDWFGRPLWEMEPTDADTYFGRVLRQAAAGTRHARAAALTTYFEYLHVRHAVELHAMTGRVVACPVDEMNRPKGRKDARLRIPPPAEEIERFFSGWAAELAACRKFAPTARNYAAARLMAEIGLRAGEVRQLDLADVRWELGRFGKIHVRYGKGARGSGPRERMVPLINDAGRTLKWYIEDIWGLFDDDHERPGAPLFPSERRTEGSSSRRLGPDTLRCAVAAATRAHLPGWEGRLTPHVLRHFCASQLYLNGMDLAAIQETLGHSWIATTMRYVHVHREHVEQAWVTGQQRAAQRVEGLV